MYACMKYHKSSNIHFLCQYIFNLQRAIKEYLRRRFLLSTRGQQQCSASDQALPREPSNLIRIKTRTSHLLLSNWNNPPTDLSNFYGILDWPNFTPTLFQNFMDQKLNYLELTILNLSCYF